MAGQLVSHQVWERIAPLLPARPERPKGGRPPIGDREVLTGILFVLKTGIPWEELPLELGYGCGMTCLRRLRTWQQSDTWSDIRTILEESVPSSRRLDWRRLGKADSSTASARVPATGMNPTAQEAVMSASQARVHNRLLQVASFTSHNRPMPRPTEDHEAASRMTGG